MKLSNLNDVQIETYSDSQISEMLNRAKSSGYSESELYTILSDKGLPQVELDKLRNRVEKLKRNGPISVAPEKTVGSDKRFNPSTGQIEVTSATIDSTIFGSELFNTSTLAFEPNLRIPAPPNYMLGPDDEIVISVYGYSEKKYDLTVNELGQIYIPNVGPIVVNGLTLEEAEQKIKSKLAATIYSAIRTGQTKVDVTLGKIRSIRVTVIGQAKKPGTYTVSSLTTLYNVLYLCGGPTDMGSFRDIEVIRGSQKQSADLYDFLVYGNQKDNILLKEGDVIRIPYYLNRVTLTGNVKRQGKFELLSNETFSDLLNYSGGFTDLAYRGAVTVERVTDSAKRIIDLPSTEFKTFIAKSSDHFTVGRLQDEFGNRIYITGSVQRPGPYELTPGMTVQTLLQKAGGYTSDASRDRALLYRYLPNKLPAIEALNLDSISRAGQFILLQKNDSLVIKSIFFFRDADYVTIEGKVRNPGQFQWRQNLTLKDALFERGGIDESGDSSNIEIARRLANVNVSETNHLESKIIKVDLSRESIPDIELQPFDIIIVKNKPGYTPQRTVLVQGEVLSPGKYALNNSITRVTDIIERTGGFKSSADSNALTIRRINNPEFSIQERRNVFEKILNISQDSLDKNPTLMTDLYENYSIVNIDLERALRSPGSSQNLPLEDGDILTVNRVSNLVKVSGEIYFPSTVAFKPNQSLKYYVEQAGNFTPQSRKNSAMVIHRDGKVESVKHFLFFRSYPRVSPGAEILVPKKTPRNREKISIGELSVVLSSLALVANLIFNMSK